MKAFASIVSILISFMTFAKDMARRPASMSSFDGFPLEAIIEVPKDLSRNDVKKVVVFVHGSGPQSLDEDLSLLTVPKGSTNLFFRDMAESFLKKNIATVRYNKRSYELKRRIEANPDFQKSEEFRRVSEHPLDYTIKDCAFFVDQAQKEFPNAEVFILGHSEGTRVALNVAKDKKSVKGTILIGFSNESIASSILEQVVYRELIHFYILDKNRDGFLALVELRGKAGPAKVILQQMAVLDINGDRKLSLSEYKAGNYSNLILKSELYNQSYIMDEATLPRSSDIIKGAPFKVLFLQGEYDNQTPAYYTEAIELLNKLVWKKKELKFIYFEKAGHALDPRDNVNDLNYRVVTAETLNKVSQAVAEL
jgi:pimeloyl-ACP methyl ester carboxylesterase